MKKSEFFNSPQSWSKRKHRLLSKYLVPFSAKIGSMSPEIYCIDGFAGKGQYENGDDGSPLLMARIADDYAVRSPAISLKLINVEANRINYNKLCEVTQPWVKRGIVTNEKGRFGDQISKIMLTIGETPALFFIDPYGPSPIHFDYLRPVLTRKQPITELIINFDLDGLRRLADDLRAKTRTNVGRKACQTIVGNVTKILGRDRWMQFFATDRLGPMERQKVLLDDYIDSLSTYGYHVVAYPIRNSMGSAPKYYLVYYTRHRDGVALMNRFIRNEEDQLLRESWESDQLLLVDPLDAEVHTRRGELRNEILAFALDRPKLTRGTIKSHFIFNRFADFDDTDYNKVVQELIETAVLSTSTGRNRINDDVLLTYNPPHEKVPA